MAMQKQDDQHVHTFSNYVRIQDVILKTCLRRWTIGKSGSGISLLPARHDDDDNAYRVKNHFHCTFIFTFYKKLFFQSLWFVFYLFICIQSYWIRIILSISTWPIDGTQTGTATPGKSGPESNANEEIFYTHHISRTVFSPSAVVYASLSDTQKTHFLEESSTSAGDTEYS